MNCRAYEKSHEQVDHEIRNVSNIKRLIIEKGSSNWVRTIKDEQTNHAWPKIEAETNKEEHSKQQVQQIGYLLEVYGDKKIFCD